MGSMNILLIAIAFVAFVASPTLAKDFMVGDDSGWTINFDYQTWAQGKEFRVGDRLIFKYKEGAHNVHKVNGTGFQQCLPSSAPLATGNDVIPLATPGRKWYICGVGKHCEVGGQKLVITVLSQLESPAPAPSASAPTSAAIGITFSKYFAVMIATFSAFLMILV